METLAHIVQEGRRQQITVVLAGGFQALEHLEGMRLLRGLHPPEEDNLFRRKVRQEPATFDARRPPKGGLPELAGTVDETGEFHGFPGLPVQLSCTDRLKA